MKSFKNKNKRLKTNWFALIKQAHLEDEFEIYCFIHCRSTRHQKGISLNRAARAFCCKHKLPRKINKDFSSLNNCVKAFNEAYGYLR